MCNFNLSIYLSIYLYTYLSMYLSLKPTFCVVSLGPVVASSALAEHEVVGTENITVGPRPN